MSNEELTTLTVRQLSKATGIGVWRIYELAKKGMPHFKVGMTLRFRRSEVAKWMREQEAQTAMEG